MRPLNTAVERFIPSALIFAIVLTVLVALMALLLTDSGPVAVIQGWGTGLSGLLEFMTQMALVLLLGHALASTRPVRASLGKLASVPRSPLRAYVFVFVIAAMASLITWGFGLVIGGLLAREVAAEFARRRQAVSFPMLVASGFSGFVVWHMGYSGSGPLTAATPGSFIEKQVGHIIPIRETIFSWWNISAIVVTLNIVNWMFLGLIFLLSRNTFEVMGLVKNAASNVGDILLQFPLYAGIMGIMTATGLIQVLSDSIVAVASPQTLGLLAFLSAGLVNFFVPSGGGQVAIQAPILLDAAARLDVDPSVVIMAVPYGDQWTNMIQPFWALPLLAIAGLKIRDILGYTTVVLLVSGIVFAATMLVVGAGV
ncbi:short-chain fatty acid transporter [Kocuria sp. CPCC 205297]|uniref:short-chain fatty acid transporter n=1 Tax=Kocuria sp. CPCC 205297 TaxID=3073558 RepID=UPI0034D500EF